MKILNSVQLKELDQFVIQLEQIKSIDLMERAGKKCFDWIKSNFSIETTFITVCGTGNNGGDGLVISRLLHLAGYQVKVIVIAHFSTRTEEFVQNFELLSELNVETISVHNELELRSVGIEESNVLIDSLLGTGLNRVADGFVAEAINFMNNHPKNTLIAIDIPSGLFCEDNISNKGAIVKATHTLTFQCPKLSFLYAENNLYVGEWYVLDIFK
jgi:ADP-dependent NAD(P)H-hydrate dehydratase / NAD(P)H-hydrate epimerase